MGESQENLLQQSQQSRGQKIRKMASKGFQKAKNLFKRKKFQTQGTQTADPTSVEQISVHSQYIEENMDRLVKHGPDLYNLFHYEKMQNSAADEGFSTPTEIVTYPDGDPKIWSDISEIRYANDVSYDQLENPKVILYRNKDNSCYIILRIEGNKHGVFYGINESHIELGGGKSFSVYGEYFESFTDDVSRLIYVDESGLYFVTESENPVEDVIKTYQSEGEFNFNGSVIKVSAIDGSITWDGEPITASNFFDNWVLENGKTILSTNQPKSNEILRNFYPPKGSYTGIYAASRAVRNDGDYAWLSGFSGRNWLDSFIKRHGLLTKAKSKNGAKELICDGTFSSILLRYDEAKAYPLRGLDSPSFYGYGVLNAIATQVEAKGGDAGGKTIKDRRRYAYTISTIIKCNSNLFKDPEFVRSLKPEFSKLEKDFEKSRITGFEEWIPFEIVRNL